MDDLEIFENGNWIFLVCGGVVGGGFLFWCVGFHCIDMLIYILMENKKILIHVQYHLFVRDRYEK